MSTNEKAHSGSVASQPDPSSDDNDLFPPDIRLHPAFGKRLRSTFEVPQLNQSSDSMPSSNEENRSSSISAETKLKRKSSFKEEMNVSMPHEDLRFTDDFPLFDPQNWDKQPSVEDEGEEDSEGSGSTVKLGEGNLELEMLDISNEKPYAILSPVIEITRVFGRDNKTGKPLDQDDPDTPKFAEMPSERLERLKRYERWNFFCRFLNESRHQSKRAMNPCSGNDFTAYTGSATTAEDFLYHAYLRDEDVEEEKEWYHKVDLDEVELLNERRETFNVNTRMEWAKRIMCGRMALRPKVHTGAFAVEYIVEEENEEMNRKSREFNARKRNGSRLHPDLS
jgi:hypothetical protein